MKNIVITGGNSGIGRELAKIFSKKNNVIILDVKVDYKVENKNIKYFKCDITDEKLVKEVFYKINLLYGNINILINNAAQQIESKFEEMESADWKKVIDTNLNGTFYCMKEVVKYMVPGSTILNVLLVHYNKPRMYKYSYDASKAAIGMLTKEAAIELASKGITINSIAFGAVNTPMNSDWIKNECIRNNVIARVPLRIIFKTEQIACMAKNIIDNLSIYTTGTIFTVDGGRSLI